MWNSGYQRAVTTATFNKLIQSASQTEGLESALKVGNLPNQWYFLDRLVKMYKNQIEQSMGNAYLYIITVHAGLQYSLWNDQLTAESIFYLLVGVAQMYRKMLDAGYKPDAITYSTLVVACNRADDLEQALSISQEMEGLGVKPNQVWTHFAMTMSSAIHSESTFSYPVSSTSHFVLADTLAFNGTTNLLNLCEWEPHSAC